MRVALVHDWLTGMRGGERVLEAMVSLYPDAEIFTLLHEPGSVSRRIEQRPIRTSFIDRLPRAADLYRYYLPFFPAAVERFDLRGFDLIISSSHCVAKGVRHPRGVPHLCYCHTPMRYIWDRFDDYFGPSRAGTWLRGAMTITAPALRRWDVRTAQRVDVFVAISRWVAERIRRCYDRSAEVVYPPVEVERFRPAANRQDFYLIVSALVPYKRVDLAIEAFNRLRRRLVVVGDGPEARRLRAMAGANVLFTGRVSDEEVADWMGRCRAFVFAGVEDFGIAVIEAQAAGAPVIAYAAGGALETVIGVNGHHESGGAPERRKGPATNGATGVFFHEQTVEALIDAVRRFEALHFDIAAIQAHAHGFAAPVFARGLQAQIDRLISPQRDADRASEPPRPSVSG
ncbi:MAG: glycosyltransferase [Gemmatimonadetes bacterium]|nr:glycosyltransferase [Gemmatimonadota bacterium]